MAKLRSLLTSVEPVTFQFRSGIPTTPGRPRPPTLLFYVEMRYLLLILLSAVLQVAVRADLAQPAPADSGHGMVRRRIFSVLQLPLPKSAFPQPDGWPPSYFNKDLLQLQLTLAARPVQAAGKDGLRLQLELFNGSETDLKISLMFDSIRPALRNLKTGQSYELLDTQAVFQSGLCVPAGPFKVPFVVHSITQNGQVLDAKIVEGYEFELPKKSTTVIDLGINRVRERFYKEDRKGEPMDLPPGQYAVRGFAVFRMPGWKRGENIDFLFESDRGPDPGIKYGEFGSNDPGQAASPPR